MDAGKMGKNEKYGVEPILKKDVLDSQITAIIGGRPSKKLRAANKPEYITGTGQKLWRIHDEEKCKGSPCVIHNPSDHSMRDFPTHWRSDRDIMERLCEHSVGHPDPDSPFERGSYEWIHGCDGCCEGSHKEPK